MQKVVHRIHSWNKDKLDLLEKVSRATGLPKDYLGHKPDKFMEYEKDFDWHINNLERAVKVFEKFANEKKPIFIYCDYDVDGMGAAAIMRTLCNSLNIKAEIYVPDRFKDGYGLTEKFVNERSDIKDALLMTFDNGIAAHAPINIANNIGWTTVVMDHHLPVVDGFGDISLPDAEVVCDPHVTGADCEEYCGAGLAYKFAQRCYEDVKKIPDDRKKQLLEMMCSQATISTIADSVPLTGENYQIVEKGLALISVGKCTYGTKLLAEKFGALGKDKLSASDLSFGLIAGLNAWGRLDGNGSKEVAELLAYTGPYDASIIDKVNTVVSKNDERKFLTGESVKRAEEMMQEKGWADDNMFVIYDKDCPLGLCGLVAGRLAEKYHVPCVVVTDAPETPGLLKGSGRSYGDPPSVNLKELLDGIQDTLEAYGGHEAACGLSIAKDMVDTFRKRALAVVPEKQVIENSFDCDIVCKSTQAYSLYGEASKYVWGVGNPEPTVLITGYEVSSSRTMGKDGSTLKLTSTNPKTNQTVLDVLSFGGAPAYEEMGSPTDMAVGGTLSMNVWQPKGRPPVATLQLMMDFGCPSQELELKDIDVELDEQEHSLDDEE